MGFGGNPKDPSAVRGGPAFELMFNVDTLLRRRGVRDRFELTFFAPMASPGERMGKKAVAGDPRDARPARDRDALREEDHRLRARAASLFEDGSRLDADLVDVPRPPATGTRS